ncbi:hypothetical protein BGZ83_001132 [Gryganskiella cystojenkinii]|nr:hypothetical protein BGZ83_001132 [Gryganskiella cystojenkinii]
MNKSARKAVNLSVLQRHDANITDIIDSSSYVVVYKFDEDSQAWTKKGVEGTMFVFKRSAVPSYGFFIMNRLGIDNLMADLTADMALQLTADYIIYRDEKDIHGIWIYEPTDRDRIGEKLLDCCKKAKDETPPQTAQPRTPSSNLPATSSHSHTEPQQDSLRSASANQARVDPLSKMLSDAMSRARVSETSGVPLIQERGSPSTVHAASRPHSQHVVHRHEDHLSLSSGQSPQLGRNVASQLQDSNNNKGPSSTASTNEIPSFLMAIISKEKEPETGARKQASSELNETVAPSSNSLIDALSGSGRQSQSSVPLSAEFLPASVMPNGLYPSNRPSSNINHRNDMPGHTSHQQQQQYHPSPSSTIAAASLLNRPNGIPAHGSPLQAQAMAYSPGMMPSPLAMTMMPGGHMRPPPQMNGGAPHLHHPHPPPPPMSFPHHPGGPSMMGLPAPPPPPSNLPMGLASFPADAMHAAMGAVGFMQQQQRGFVSNGAEVMPKAEFAQRFMGLLQTDPQFMDVLYSNYTAVLARRG